MSEAQTPDLTTAPSSARLAKAIRAHPRYNALDLSSPLLRLAARAEANYYHDYLSPLAAPSTQLMADLRAVGLDDLVSRHLNGEFDADKAESDTWAASPEGRAALASLPPELSKALRVADE